MIFRTSLPPLTGCCPHRNGHSCGRQQSISRKRPQCRAHQVLEQGRGEGGICGFGGGCCHTCREVVIVQTDCCRGDAAPSVLRWQEAEGAFILGGTRCTVRSARVADAATVLLPDPKSRRAHPKPLPPQLEQGCCRGGFTFWGFGGCFSRKAFGKRILVENKSSQQPRLGSGCWDNQCVEMNCCLNI